MKKYVLFCFLLINVTLFAQTNKEIIKESTSYFSLDSLGNFNGEGALFIKKKIAESQFLLLGEQHEIHAIELFVERLIPYLKENGYSHYAAEIGPVASRKLMELKLQSVSLKSYYEKYMPQINMTPFGFFSTIEEEKTLEKLMKYDIAIWGIDFENYGSYLSIIDMLYENSDKNKISKQLYQSLYSYVTSEYKKGENNFNPALMNNLLHSKEMSVFLDLTDNEINNFIIKQFKLSLEINHQLTLGYWHRRVENMKKNFSEYYHYEKAKEDTVKVIVKLGAVHTARGTSFSGNIEIGNMIYELANINRAKSFSIITFPRYIQNPITGKTEDVADEESKELLGCVDSNQWTVIDLNKLKTLSIRYNITLSKNINSYIQKYDAILIPPETKYSIKIIEN